MKFYKNQLGTVKVLNSQPTLATRNVNPNQLLYGQDDVPMIVSKKHLTAVEDYERDYEVYEKQTKF
jgi:hypothetical protein